MRRGLSDSAAAGFNWVCSWAPSMNWRTCPARVWRQRITGRSTAPPPGSHRLVGHWRHLPRNCGVCGFVPSLNAHICNDHGVFVLIEFLFGFNRAAVGRRSQTSKTFISKIAFKVLRKTQTDSLVRHQTARQDAFRFIRLR